MATLQTNEDIGRNLKISQAINIAAYTATTTSAAVDLDGVSFQSTILVNTGALSAADGTNYMALSVTQSTELAGTYTAVDADQIDLVNGWDGKIDALTDANKTYRMNLRIKPDYRYITVAMTETGTFDGVFGVQVVFFPCTQPVYNS